jgi:hypothetical protein
MEKVPKLFNLEPGTCPQANTLREKNAVATFLSGNTDYSAAEMAQRITLTSSIAYAERSRHRLDICRPTGSVAAPVVIFFMAVRGGAATRNSIAMWRRRWRDAAT